MDALTGVRAERALDDEMREAFAAWCERGGGTLRAWRAASTVACTFAVVAGALDEHAAERILDCVVHFDRPPAMYVSLEPSAVRGSALLEAALGGRGAPDGVCLERRNGLLMLRVATERTPYAVVRDLIGLELAPTGSGCAVRLLSPIDLRTVVGIAADGLGAPISAHDVLEARL
ncbi:hypothetical protein EPN44_00230 [bacterium]|nr:MAG: hypothetical protein EPN44_00230 [bacterium]